MKHLCIVRHGENEGDALTLTGKSQMAGVARDIKTLAGDGPILVLYGPDGRCTEAAEIVAGILGTTAEAVEFLQDVPEPPSDAELQRLVRQFKPYERGVITAVLITHGTVVEGFSSTYIVEEGSWPKRKPFKPWEKGQGWFIDRVSKRVIAVPQAA